MPDPKEMVWLALLVAITVGCSATATATREPTRRPTAIRPPTLVPTSTLTLTATPEPSRAPSPATTPTASRSPTLTVTATTTATVTSATPAAPTAIWTSTATPSPASTATPVPVDDMATSTPVSQATTAAAPVPAEACIGADAAGDHAGEISCVEFTVVSAHNSGKAVFLNSADPYEGHFYAVIFPESWNCWPQAAEVVFAGRHLRARGEIKIYKGAPEIIIEHCDQLELLP